ncbi:MAG: PBP1A family penicillin-binding protein [Bdellovibrionales bacterium]|nr:PBP1A family penicillin-binding protein [Bdellovibrionales bacterium]
MKWLKYLTIAFLSSLGLGILALALITAHYSRNLPSIDALRNYQPRLVTRIYDRDDKVLLELSTERRFTIEPQDMPKTVIDAFVSAEDDEFFTHRGVNPVAILRASLRNLRAGHTAQGGSTITQQVAKSILLTPERTIDRKIKEVILAFRMERALSKADILNLYLNQIFLGNGAYGIEAAAQTYFGKSAKELSVAEAAVLAGLPRAPSRDNPAQNPKGAMQRQRYVLGRMLESHRITKDAYDTAMHASLQIRSRREAPSPAPYATEYIRRYLIQKYGADTVYGEGLKVYTTLSMPALQAAQDAIKSGLLALDKRIGLRKPSKTLKGPEERAKYLANEHRELVEEFFDYNILTPTGELTSPAKDKEPTPLQLGKNYHAVVMDKDARKRALVVQVGNRKGIIKPEDYSWATESDPEEIYAEKVIRSPYGELQKGDVVTVQPRFLEVGKDEFFLTQEPIVQGALLSYSVPDGELLAMVGGYDFAVTKSEFNRATQAVRQPGSTFKPFVYGCAMENGLTPSTIIVDSPIVYRDNDEKTQVEKVWRPDNFGDKFYGDTRLREAITHSRNIPTIKLLQYLKIQPVIDFARKLGVKSNLAQDLSLALGSSGMTLEELVGAYGVFADGGTRLPMHAIRRIEDRNGKILEEHQAPKNPEQIITPATAFLTTSLLRSVVENGTGQYVKALGRPTAGKTGTTSDSKDALFMGFIPQMVTGVWVGFDEDRPLGRSETGARAAAPIWLQYMQLATANLPIKDFEVPPSVIQAQVDEETGDVPTPKTRRRITEYFADGTAPGQTPPAPTDKDKVASATPVSVNRTKVITGNPDLPASSNSRPGTNQSEEGVSSDEFYRNDL